MNIQPTEIAKEFDLVIQGTPSTHITGPGSFSRLGKDLVYWLKHPKFADRISEGNLIISEQDYALVEHKASICYLVTKESPRLIFAKVLQKYFGDMGLRLTPNAVDTHRTNKAIFISDNVYIADDVHIGDGTIIHPNVVIHNRTYIGENCVIKANTTIGTEGLGYETNEEGQLVKFPQLGGVQIGDDVEIGPSATVRRGALDDTIIEHNVKIGSFSNVGHNCVIGANTILTCQCVTGGSSVIGNNSFLGIQAIIKNGISVAPHTVVGAGAVVVKSIPEATTVVGSPATTIGKYKEWSVIKKGLIAKNQSET